MDQQKVNLPSLRWLISHALDLTLILTFIQHLLLTRAQFFFFFFLILLSWISTASKLTSLMT